MAHEVIMPALGMAQDTGVIVAWHKNPGDAVRADDILAEVETDKTTMEIDVGHDGVLACVMAEAGVEVPVGNVIAIIAATPEEAGDIARGTPMPGAADRLSPPGAAAAPGAAAERPAAAAPARAPSSPPPQVVAGTASVPGGRILASPKARRLARERGIDLRNLVAQGLPQPFHAADLDKVATTDATATAAVSVVDEFQADVAAENFDSFHRWVEAKAGTGVPAGRVWAAFAAACYREATGGEAASFLCVRVTSFGPDGEDAVLENPDRSGLLNMVEATEGVAPDLLVFDLTGTSLSNYRAGAAGIVPALIVARSGSDEIALKLQFVADRLAGKIAAEFLGAVAARAREPLLQLL